MRMLARLYMSLDRGGKRRTCLRDSASGFFKPTPAMWRGFGPVFGDGGIFLVAIVESFKRGVIPIYHAAKRYGTHFVPTFSTARELHEEEKADVDQRRAPQAVRRDGTRGEGERIAQGFR